MKNIERHTYRTPLRDSGENDYSIGVMNLSVDEVKWVQQFVDQLTQLRRTKNRVESITFPVMGPVRLNYEQPPPATVTATTPSPIALVTPAASEPGNRFSGLDFGDDK